MCNKWIKIIILFKVIIKIMLTYKIQVIRVIKKAVLNFNNTVK